MTTFATPAVQTRDLPLADLAATIRGRVLTPADSEYPALATPWNVSVPCAPLAVVEVRGAEDVAATVKYAIRHGVDVAVRSTGHGATVLDRPAILVHTRLLDEITIDPAGSARVGAGVKWDRVIDAAAPHGLAALVGSSTDVGVVGYLTGGGMSPIGRSFGYASDYVTAFDVVTGDGVIRRATASENPALFWGLRGGKGALGIVTAVEFDMLPLAEIYGGCLFFDGSDAAAVSHAWRTWSATLPETASTSLAFMRLPDAPMIPAPIAGRLTVAVRFASIGAPEEGARLLADITGVAPVIFGGVGPMPFAAIGSIHADPVDPMPSAEHSALLSDLPAEAITALIATAGPESACTQIIVELRRLGGAFARTPRVPSAVSHRNAAVNLFTVGLAIPPLTAANTADQAAITGAVAPWVIGRQVNFNSTTDPAEIAQSYEKDVLGRLGTLAATYDPHGIISVAHALRSACMIQG